MLLSTVTMVKRF